MKSWEGAVYFILTITMMFLYSLALEESLTKDTENINIKLDTIMQKLDITPTPTIDIDKLKLTQENEKLKQEVQTLQIFKNDLEGFMEAQIRR